MISIELNEIPDELFLHFKNKAALHRRSLNSEILQCLASQLIKSPDPIHTYSVPGKNLLTEDELHALLSPKE
ncbi:MAG: Arc family DNA-binding protein [Acidithiobacillus sp.]